MSFFFLYLVPRVHQINGLMVFRDLGHFRYDRSKVDWWKELFYIHLNNSSSRSKKTVWWNSNSWSMFRIIFIFLFSKIKSLKVFFKSFLKNSLKPLSLNKTYRKWFQFLKILSNSGFFTGNLKERHTKRTDIQTLFKVEFSIKIVIPFYNYRDFH